MNKFHKGIKYSLITALLSGIAIFLNGIVVKAVGNPLVFTTVKNAGVALIIGALLILRSKKKQIQWKRIQGRDWLILMAIGILGGSIPFYLFFQGLSLAQSSSAALIHKTLIFWVAFLAVPLLNEKVSIKQAVALSVIFATNFLIGGIENFRFGKGEMMILAATILWAVENFIAKLSLRKLDVDVVVGARMIFGSLILLVATTVTGKLNLIFNLNVEQWFLTLITVGFLTGYVVCWYRALRLAPITVVATILSLGSLVTNILSVIFITHRLNIAEILQAALIASCVWVFLVEAKKYVGSKTYKLSLS
jgi:drug/metabolite transporter (DMT)-like permease